MNCVMAMSNCRARSFALVKKMLSGIVGFVGLGIGLMYAPQIYDRWIIVDGLIGIAGPGNNADIGLAVPVDSHTKGDAKAKVTLVKFADFVCPPCKMAIGPMDDLLKTRPDVKFVFRQFPMTMIPAHKWALQCAIASEAAGRQSKFWPMHDVLYQHQDETKELTFDPVNLQGFAKEVGLDVERFKKDMEDTAVQKRVAKDIAAAETLGVKGTPCFFLVSATKIWKFPQMSDLKQAFDNPDHSIWKEK